MGNGFRAVTFDLDGTLYDSRSLKRHFALHNILFLRSIRQTLAVRESMRGQEFEDGAAFRTAEMTMVAQRLGITVPNAHRRVERLLGERLNRSLGKIGPRPDVIPVLDRLLSEGIKIAVVSDYAVTEKLDALGLSHLPWSARIAADGIGALKPSPRAFVEATEQLKIPPHEILHVGDREDTDGKGAREAGFGVFILDLHGHHERPFDDPKFRQLIEAGP